MPELQFKGKEFVYNHHLTVPYRPLVPDPEKSIGDASLNGNLIIHGDNLHALKALLPMYAGKVDCIFIDPPYNTGNEGWSYNDNVNSPMMKEWLSSNPINAEDMLRHDKWCAMMWPRLQLLRELLSDNGSFWMTIDDNEVHHARSLLDEIFGEDRFLASVVWQKRTSPEARLRLGAAHDYVLVYGNGTASEGLKKLSHTEDQTENYDNPDDDPRGPWTSTDFTAQGYRPNQMYQITTPAGRTYEPPPGRCWGNIEPEYLRLRAEGRLWFGINGTARPRMKTYLSESEGVSAWTWWSNSEVGDNQESKKELLRIMGSEEAFDYPKPLRLLARIIALATNRDSLILDSFAGSGTSAHAVLEANAKDDGKRRVILVEGEAYADRLTAERMRRVIHGYLYTGTDRKELLSERLNWTKFKNADKIVQTVALLEATRRSDFDEITKTVNDGILRVAGERRVETRMDGLGGTFTYCTLGPELDVEAILTGTDMPDYLAVAAWLFHTATGESFNPDHARPDDFFVGEASAYTVWLVYRPDLDFLKSANAALTAPLAEAIAASRAPGKKHLVFAPAKYIPNHKLQPMGIEYAPLPFALYRIEKS